MSNYTTHAASFKATNIYTRALDAKRIDTKKLFINGELFDPSQIKESPNQIIMILAIIFDSSNGNHVFGFLNENFEAVVTGICQNNKVQVDALELLSYFYPDRNISNENSPLISLINANVFNLQVDEEGNEKLEKCILDVQLGWQIDGMMTMTIKLGEEDDNLFELYGGGVNGEFIFYMSIPYATPPTQSSTFSLRQPQVSGLSLEKTRQIFEQMRQRSLDKNAE